MVETDGAAKPKRAANVTTNGDHTATTGTGAVCRGKESGTGMEALAIWTKSAHIAALVFWCACLFYIPGLFAAHAKPLGRRDFHRLRAQTRVVYLGVASPAAVIAIVSGSALIYLRDVSGGWLPLKLTAVAAMVVLHLVDGWLVGWHRERGVSRHPFVLFVLVLVPASLVGLVLWLVLARPL